MTLTLLHDRFPRSNQYRPEWLRASASGGAHSLWLTEWLTEAIDLRQGMRVLDLGCGRAASSIFLHHEFGVDVWATDLWFSPSENRQRIQDAGVGAHVFPIHADARDLPFSDEFFDAILSIDSYFYYGTDDLFLSNLARFIKPGGAIGIAGAGLLNEFTETIPDHLQAWWTHDMCCLHSAAWWKRHWERSAVVDVELADCLEDGWKYWLEWQRFIAPDNPTEIDAIEADAGKNMGYTRAVAKRRMDIKLEPPISSLTMEYEFQPFLRSKVSGSSSVSD